MKELKDTKKIAHKAYETVRQGGLTLVQADIGYGLLGHSEESIKKMYRLKGRPYSNPCIVAGNIETLLDTCQLKDNRLLEWILAITKQTTIAIVNPVNPKSKLLPSLPGWVHKQSTLDDTVAIFLNTGKYVEEMIRLANQDDFLLVGSSGNLSGQGNNYSFGSMPNSILKELDFVYDGGQSKYVNKSKLATTIINFNNFTLKRKGVNSDIIVNSFNEFARTHDFPQLTL